MTLYIWNENDSVLYFNNHSCISPMYQSRMGPYGVHGKLRQEKLFHVEPRTEQFHSDECLLRQYTVQCLDT